MIKCRKSDFDFDIHGWDYFGWVNTNAQYKVYDVIVLPIKIGVDGIYVVNDVIRQKGNTKLFTMQLIYLGTTNQISFWR